MQWKKSKKAVNLYLGKKRLHRGSNRSWGPSKNCQKDKVRAFQEEGRENTKKHENKIARNSHNYQLFGIAEV